MKKKQTKTTRRPPQRETDAPPAKSQRYVLVGTYKGDQLAKWRGWYNYPISEDDKIGAEDAAMITELWLFNGNKDQRTYKAEFVGIKTRAELIRDYGYPAKGRAHGEKYLLFKTDFKYIHKLDVPEDAKRVIIRTADFATAPKVRKQLKAYLESPDRRDPGLAKRLPEIITKLRPGQLKVCELAYQMSLWELPNGGVLKPSVPFPPPENPRFTFIDLFAGIGGFHLAMHELGGKCVFASEWDKEAQKTYEANYGIVPFGDIKKIDEKDIPHHDVLCAGFPCQPFSKAGKQEGFEDETKGTLFFDIERILKCHHTKYIILENVRNLVAHDNGNTWKTIHSHLIGLGYRLTPEPLIVSPHYFGVPQLRERVVVLGVHDPDNAKLPLKIVLPKPQGKSQCNLDTILERDNHEPEYELSAQEIEAINIWDEFYHGIKEKVIGFPIWLDWFKVAPPTDPKEMPEWKQAFVRKNNQLYKNNKTFIDSWLKRHDYLSHLTPTMRKMEWQCGESVASAWDAFMQFRPSGLRIKRPDCAPALVAIVQVPIIGKYRRRMTVREAARLQSFDDRFIPNANRHQAYKQLGNAVHVEVIKNCARTLFQETGATF